MNPIANGCSNIAWKRTLVLCAIIGGLMTIGESKDFNNGSQAIGYFVGSTVGMIVLAGGATAACSKQIKA